MDPHRRSIPPTGTLLLTFDNNLSYLLIHAFSLPDSRKDTGDDLHGAVVVDRPRVRRGDLLRGAVAVERRRADRLERGAKLRRWQVRPDGPAGCVRARRCGC